MTPSRRTIPMRLSELLADQAVQPLSPHERAELNDLLREHPDVDTEEFDRVAALIDLAAHPRRPGAVPESLRRRVESASAAWMASRRQSDHSLHSQGDHGDDAART